MAKGLLLAYTPRDLSPSAGPALSMRGEPSLWGKCGVVGGLGRSEFFLGCLLVLSKTKWDNFKLSWFTY